MGTLSPTIITASATIPSPESTAHPSPPHACGVTRGPHRRNEAYQHHHTGRPRSPESTGATAGHLPLDTVQGEKNNGLVGTSLTAVVAEKPMAGSRTASEERPTSVPAPVSSLSLDAGSSSGRTSSTKTIHFR